MAEEAQEQTPQRDAAPSEGSDTPEQRRRRRRTLIGAGIVVLVIAALIGVWYYLFKRGRVSTDDAYTDGTAVSVAAEVSGYV